MVTMPRWRKSVRKMFVAFRLCETAHTELTWSDNEDGTTLTSPLSVFVSFDIGLAYVRTYVSEPPHQTLIACLSTGEESDNICVISTWWRAPREPAQEMIWVELSTINRLITTGWFSPSKPSVHRLIQIHPLWGHSCPWFKPYHVIHEPWCP